MTAKTSENLALVLEGVGLTAMATKARADAYHDFFSNDALCALMLERELREAREKCSDPIIAGLIETIRQRHLRGDFDASDEESAEWAASPEAKDALRMLLEGK
jgi:hypothetical protein